MQLDFPECYDSLNDALKAAVMALGGFKKVGARMRPDDEFSDDWLRHCFQESRRERLTPQQALWLLREARLIGFHGAMDYLAFTAGYEAKAIDAAQQKATLQEAIAAGLERLNSQMAQLQRVNARDVS